MTANRPFWGLLSRRSGYAGTATELYGRLVALARSPAFYADLGAPDTPEGRLELIVLHVVLMLRRFGREGEGDGRSEAALLARALAETFVTDMDDNLREMGVGDIAVARKVKKAAAALFDRSRDYGAALEAQDAAALAGLLGQHVLDTTAGSAPAERLAAFMMATERALADASLADVVAGRALPDPASL